MLYVGYTPHDLYDAHYCYYLSGVLCDLIACNNKIERLPGPDTWEFGHLQNLNLKHNKLGVVADSPTKKYEHLKWLTYALIFVLICVKYVTYTSLYSVIQCFVAVFKIKTLWSKVLRPISICSHDISVNTTPDVIYLLDNLHFILTSQ